MKNGCQLNKGWAENPKPLFHAMHQYSIRITENKPTISAATNKGKSPWVLSSLLVIFSEGTASIVGLL